MFKKNLRISIISLEDIQKSFNSFLIKILKKLDIKYKISYLPKKKKFFSLLKSPHINKKAQEVFELKRFKTIIDIKLTDINLIKHKNNIFRFIFLNKPKFIKINVKKFTF